MLTNTAKIAYAIVFVGALLSLATYAGLTEEHRAYMNACMPENAAYHKGETSTRYYCEQAYQLRR